MTALVHSFSLIFVMKNEQTNPEVLANYWHDRKHEVLVIQFSPRLYLVCHAPMLADYSHGDWTFTPTRFPSFMSANNFAWDMHLFLSRAAS